MSQRQDLVVARAMDDLETYDYVLFFSRKDTALVHTFHEKLQSDGWKGCLFNEDFGSTFDNAAEKISKSEWILFYVTSNFAQDNELRSHKGEAAAFTGYGDKIIPVFDPDKSSIWGKLTRHPLYGLLGVEYVDICEKKDLERLYKSFQSTRNIDLK